MFLKQLFCKNKDTLKEAIYEPLLCIEEPALVVPEPVLPETVVPDPYIQDNVVPDPTLSEPVSPGTATINVSYEERARQWKLRRDIEMSTNTLRRKVAENVKKEHENRQPIGTFMKFLDKLISDNVINEDFVKACKEYEGKEYAPSYDPCRYAMYHKRADVFAYAMGSGIAVTSDIYSLPIQTNYIEGLAMLCDLKVPFPDVVETTPLNIPSIKYLISRGLKPDSTARMLGL